MKVTVRFGSVAVLKQRFRFMGFGFSRRFLRFDLWFLAVHLPFKRAAGEQLRRLRLGRWGPDAGESRVLRFWALISRPWVPPARPAGRATQEPQTLVLRLDFRCSVLLWQNLPRGPQ